MGRRWFLNLMALVGAVLASGAIGAAPAAAQTGVAGHPVAVCVTPAKTGMKPRALFAQANSFNCNTKQTEAQANTFNNR